MDGELHLRRKWTLRAHGEQVVFVKHRYERAAQIRLQIVLTSLRKFRSINKIICAALMLPLTPASPPPEPWLPRRPGHPGS